MASTTYPLRTTVRVTAKENAVIERKAQAAGLSKSRYLARTGTADGPPSFIDPSGQIERLETFVRELRRQGENLNELARVARTTGIRNDEVVRASEAVESCAVSLTRLIESLYTGESSLTADGHEIYMNFDARIVPSPLWRQCAPAEIEWVRFYDVVYWLYHQGTLSEEIARMLVGRYPQPSKRDVDDVFPGFR